VIPHGARSCRPNAVVSFKGQKLVVRALGHIAAGEEVTIAYVELYQPTQYRRLQATPPSYYSHTYTYEHVCGGAAARVWRKAAAAPSPSPLSLNETGFFLWLE